MSNADLHQLTKSRVDKDHLIEFAYIFLLDHEPVGAIQSTFNIQTISHYFPEFPETVKSWIDQNAK